MKFKNFDRQKLLFCNITWMREYQGITENDRPHEGGSYVKDTDDAAEKFNFQLRKNCYYGYSPPAANNMHLENLGAPKDAPEVSGVTVIWIAKSPYKGEKSGRRVVGWYKNATVYNTLLEKYDHPYRVYARGQDCLLFPEVKRTLQIPPKGKGRISQQSAISYGRNIDLSDRENKVFLKNLDDLLSGFVPPPPRKKRKNTDKKRRQMDVEIRQAVECAAVDCVQKYYEDNYWDVESVESQNKGWDLTITSDLGELRVEVKGHQGDQINSELTPNEYTNAKCKSHNYLLAVVTKALSAKPCLRIFEPIHKTRKKLTWRCIYGKDTNVKTEERTSAIISEAT